MHISSSYPTIATRWTAATSKTGKAPSTASETAGAQPTDGFILSTAPAEVKAKAVVASAESVIKGETPTVEIAKVQEQLTEGLKGVGVEFLHTDAFSKLNGRLATMTELNAMMESLYDESNIPYEYITDGCYARAHLMDESLRQHGINNAKMFCRGDLEAKNDVMSARWWYHVAPLVFVDDGSGTPIPKIVDPGFSKQPMDPEQWVAAMNKGPRVEIDLVDAEQYYPRENAADDNFAESLSPAVKTMQGYSKRLHGIKKSAGIPVGDYKTPTWDKPGSGGDFVVDGKTLFVFPEGVQTSREPAYKFLDVNGTIMMEPVPEKEPVSASWDKRPAGFDPYATR